MTITVKTMSEAYAWIEKMMDKFDEWDIVVGNNGIEVRVFDK